MKIAVVQHALRPTPAQDLEALVLAAARAEALSADVVVLPFVGAVQDGPLGDDLFRRLEEDAPGVAAIVPQAAAWPAGGVETHEHPLLGRAVVLAGDTCLDIEALGAAAAQEPGLLVLCPGSESELQAEAVLEMAIALSTSAAAVVVVAETDGAEPGEPGHGGSLIVQLGEVLAEAVGGDGLLTAEPAPALGRPEAPGPLPELAPVLLQRLAVHEGRRLSVDYPADLT